MSRPMRLTAHDAKRLSDALEGISEIARRCEVRIDAYGPVDLQVTNQTIVRIRWDDAQGRGEYVIDDQNGD